MADAPDNAPTHAATAGAGTGDRTIEGETDTLDLLVLRAAPGHRIACIITGGGDADDDVVEVSYERLAGRVDAVVAGLLEAGVDRGDRVVFCGLNRLELFELLLACCRLGAILCPINNRLTAAEVAVQLADCRPSVLLATDGFHELLADASSRIDGPRASVRDLDAVPFDDATEPVATGGTPPSAGSLADPALMVYTSGTTGSPKGAVHTQASLLATWRNSIAHQDLGPDDTIVAVVPSFHVGGLNIQTFPTLLVGGRVVLPRRFDPGEVLALIRTHRPTQTLLVPAMLTAIAGHPDFASTDLSCLTGINTGSSIVPGAAMAPYFDRGIPVGQVYGSTETGPTAVVLRYDDAAANIGSCGQPAELSELRIVADGADVDDGETGELWVRGPNVFSHYWDKPAETEAAFVDGWFRTGDVGRRDDAGFVTIVDRLTDVVISGGENVYPAEVEAVLLGHPAIADVAVIGLPDPRWGEAPVAVVLAADDQSVDVAEVRAWCDGRLARFKQPRRVVVVDELPRTALGKVRKHELRAQLEQT